MKREELFKRLFSVFSADLDEYLRRFNRDLVSLEKAESETQRMELIDELLRTAHGLKGASRSIGTRVIATGCHNMEDVLTRLRAGRVASESDYEFLFATVDAIQGEGLRLKAGGALEEQDLEHLPAIPGREPASAQMEQPLQAPAETAASTDASTDASTGASTGFAGTAGRAGTSSKVVESDRLRVMADQLDVLMMQSGELLISQRRTAAWGQKLDSLLELVEQWRTEWRQLRGPLQTLMSDASDRAQESAAALVRRVLGKRGWETLQQSEGRLRTLQRELHLLNLSILRGNLSLVQSTEDLHDRIRRARMFRFIDACSGLRRVVRDLGKESGKQVELAIEGGGLALDRTIVKNLEAPLMHLVRNAVVHGIEDEASRLAAGKPAAGHIVVSASIVGARVRVEVLDDGGGLDYEAIRRQAKRKGLTVPEAEEDLSRLILQLGFSTARMVTEVSGRGIGLNAVRDVVEGLHGSVEVFSEQGRGTRFVLTLPVTLATVRALLLEAGGQTFALPTANVEQVLHVRPRRIETIGGQPRLMLDDALVPVASLSHTLGLRTVSPASEDTAMPVVVVLQGGKRVAFMVAALLAEEEIVVRSMGARLENVEHFAGATILPGGQAALILHMGDLIRTALTRSRGPGLASSTGPQEAATPARLLVVDDSVTVRVHQQEILEAAGYEVTLAVDGLAAWELLQERTFDLVIADVQMPQMDGLLLTETIRQHSRLADLPVILVTALASEEDKVRGLRVGANAYVTKSAFEATALLEIIEQLL